MSSPPTLYVPATDECMNRVQCADLMLCVFSVFTEAEDPSCFIRNDHGEWFWNVYNFMQSNWWATTMPNARMQEVVIQHERCFSSMKLINIYNQTTKSLKSKTIFLMHQMFPKLVKALVEELKLTLNSCWHLWQTCHTNTQSCVCMRVGVFVCVLRHSSVMVWNQFACVQ